MNRKPLKTFVDECIRCGICVNTCGLFDNLDSNPGDIAHAVLSDETSDEMIAALQRCGLCGLCGEDCPANLNPAKMVVAARGHLASQNKIPIDDYEVALVDRDWNAFSMYRETFGIDYTDLHREKYDVLFLPGCTLATFAPELTRATHQWLQSQGISLGFSELCCGEPLSNTGLNERAHRYHDYLARMLEKAGATKLIAACPGSYWHLTRSLPGIQVLSLYRVMKDVGFRVGGSRESLTVHDSCADRHAEGPAAGEDIREMLEKYDLVEMEHNRRRSICCGSGGMVSLVDADLCHERAKRRVREFEATGASRIVTACMTCSYSLSPAAQPGSVVHFLELAFGISVDHAQIRENLYAMWEGEQGEINQDRLAQARSFTSREG